MELWIQSEWQTTLAWSTIRFHYWLNQMILLMRTKCSVMLPISQRTVNLEGFASAFIDSKWGWIRSLKWPLWMCHQVGGKNRLVSLHICQNYFSFQLSDKYLTPYISMGTNSLLWQWVNYQIATAKLIPKNTSNAWMAKEQSLTFPITTTHHLRTQFRFQAGVILECGSGPQIQVIEQKNLATCFSTFDDTGKIPQSIQLANFYSVNGVW